MMRVKIALPNHQQRQQLLKLQRGQRCAVRPVCMLTVQPSRLSPSPRTSTAQHKLLRNAGVLPKRASRKHAVSPKAMVNVDFASPSLVLGAVLIGCGVVLLQMRNLQTRVSRDADIVVAAMISIVGSTLIFQGWRLDPLLLLCQALTTSVAVWYGIETFRLRSKEEELEQQQQQQQNMLPPPSGGPNWNYGPNVSRSQPQQQQGYGQQQQGAPFVPVQQSQQGGPQQPQVVNGTANPVQDLMGMFMQATPLQQQFMTFDPTQQAGQQYPQQQSQGYPQQAGVVGPTSQLPVSGYLPASTTEEYPWMVPSQQFVEDAYAQQAQPMGVYDQQQGYMPTQGYASPAPWQYDSNTPVALVTSSSPYSVQPENTIPGYATASQQPGQDVYTGYTGYPEPGTQQVFVQGSGATAVATGTYSEAGAQSWGNGYQAITPVPDPSVAGQPQPTTGGVQPNAGRVATTARPAVVPAPRHVEQIDDWE